MPFPVDLRFIEKAEADIGLRLPNSFREQLLRTNGGAVSLGDNSVWWLHPVFDGSSKERVRRTCNHIVRETDAARDWPGFPTEALAIGHDGAGNFLVLIPGGDGVFGDAVFVWDHETEELEKVSDSFRQLEWCQG